MITYLIGDATNPTTPGHRVIVHVCNNYGGWGRGFVLALSKRWKQPEMEYRKWHRQGSEQKKPFGLGQIQLVEVTDEIDVVNMVAQAGNRISISALKRCLARLSNLFDKQRVTIHMPRIGCGLGGGTWSEIGPIVDAICKDLEVFVYDLPGV